jgi:hypothetical protein
MEVNSSWHAMCFLLWNVKEAIKDNTRIMLATKRRSIQNDAQIIRIDLSKNSMVEQ